MYNKKFTLPSKEELHKSLLEVDDNAHLMEHFYPMLIKHAGEEVTPAGVVIMLQTSVYEYGGGIPTALACRLYERMTRYIEALCLNRERAAEARLYFYELMSE